MKKEQIVTLVIVLLVLFGVGFLIATDNSKPQPPIIVEVQINPLDTFRKEPETIIVSDDIDFIDNGRKIYRGNCGPCHSFTRDLIAPKISDRITYRKMYDIICSINTLEANKDPYTLELLKQWDSRCGRMHEFGTMLTEKEMQELLSYLKYEINNRIH
jgi:mono/diheme cytochrome c family protein